jgi:rhamnose utilization protein RhaD (predicted bifunctional aldolase and dehydrogenase)
MAKDPLTGQEVEVMWIKGSGGDIGTLKKAAWLLYMLIVYAALKTYTVALSMRMKWLNYLTTAFSTWLQKRHL